MTTPASANRPGPVTTSPVAQGSGRRWLALAFIALGQFVIATDVTVVNIALPHMQRDLAMSDAGRQWVVAAYTVTFAGALLGAGRLADRLGHRTALVWGLLAFAAASALAALAGGLALFFGARVAQGFAGAFVSPSALALVSQLFPRGRERSMAMGVYSAIAGSGLALGLVVGGVLTEAGGWRATFWFLVPCAVVAAVGAVRQLPAGVGTARSTVVDVLGAVAALAAVGGLALGVAQAQRQGVWSPGTVTCAVVVLFAVVLLVWRQRRAEHPLLPPALFRDPRRVGAYIVTVTAIMGLFGLFILATYYLQEVCGFSPVQTGLAFLPLVGSMALGATQLSGRFAATHPLPLVTGGFAVALLALLILRDLTVHSSYVTRILPAEVLLGLGVGIILVPCTTASTYGVAPRDAASAASVYAAVQQVGASLGTILMNGAGVAMAATYASAHPLASEDEVFIAGFVDALAVAALLIVAGVLAALLLVRPLERGRPQTPVTQEVP